MDKIKDYTNSKNTTGVADLMKTASIGDVEKVKYLLKDIPIFGVYEDFKD